MINRNKRSLKRKSLKLTSVGLLTAMAGLMSANASSADRYDWQNASEITSPEELIAWQAKMSTANEEKREELIARDLKLKAMYDYAKTVAIRAAMNSQLNSAAKVIENHSRELDAIYNFSPLMIQNRVVPPVITEARDLYNQNGLNQIRLSNAVFNIEQQARFSSTPPSWRSYLNFKNQGNAYDKLSYVAGDMKPSNKLEEKIWVDAVEEGWELGSRQAGIVLKQAMDRLNRDYVGMVRFHKMVLEGKITMPSISSYNLYDNNEGNRLVLGEELLQIDVLPTFKNAINLGNGIKNTISNKLSNTANKVETPEALNISPTKEVYRTVEKIRNGQDITEQPWKDSMPLAQRDLNTNKAVYINIEPKDEFLQQPSVTTSPELIPSTKYSMAPEIK